MAKAVHNHQDHLQNEVRNVSMEVAATRTTGFKKGIFYFDSTFNRPYVNIGNDITQDWRSMISVFGVDPETVGTSNAEGSSNNSARADHVHSHGDQDGGTLHAVATTGENGFMSSTDKTEHDELYDEFGGKTFTTDDTFGSASNVQVVSALAIKTYIGNQVAQTIKPPTDFDASANPNYPAADAGDSFYITAAGKIGGASGENVNIGDLVICKTTSASGNEATVGENFFITESNRDQASETVIGVTRYSTSAEVLAGTSATTAVTPANLGSFDGFIKNGTSVQADADINIDGTAVIGGTLNVAGTATVSISAKGSAGTTFLTQTSGLIQSRTAAEVLGDIGASSSSHNHTFDSLSNVVITSNSSGEIVKWNGTNWVNNTLAEAGIASKTQTLNIEGTASEVEVTGGSQDLSANRTWTVGLPNVVNVTTSVTSQTLHATASGSTFGVGGIIATFGDGSSTAYVSLDGSGSGTGTVYKEGGVTQWNLRATLTQFELLRNNDDGDSQGNALEVLQSTGAATWSSTVAGADATLANHYVTLSQLNSSVYTDEEAQDAVGTILADSDTINFNYNDATPTITADVVFQSSDTVTLSQDASGLKAVTKTFSETFDDDGDWTESGDQYYIAFTHGLTDYPICQSWNTTDDQIVDICFERQSSTVIHMIVDGDNRFAGNVNMIPTN